MNSTKTVTARIFRYDPSTDQEPRYETYTMPYEKNMRVLDVLDRISEEQHVSLAYRWFCGIKKCGACGLVVDGKPMLSCWEPAQETMTIEPLTNFPIIRDLVVDTERYDKVVLSLHPTITRRNGPGEFPEVISHNKMEPAYRLMSCLECYVCTAATAVKGLSTDGVDWSGSPGAAAMVLFAKAALDPRDDLDRKALAKASGVKDTPLYSQLKEICPNGIDILNDAIIPIKRKFWDKADVTIQTKDDAPPVFVKSDTWSAFVKLPEEIKKKLIEEATLKPAQFKEVAEAYIYSNP
jgi:fumarate reductase (CoM/CoB) subunit B